MVTVGLTEAKARLGELLDRVEAGGEVLITRRGRTIARMTSAMAAKRPPALEDLAAFRATLPTLRGPSHALLRDLRDEER